MKSLGTPPPPLECYHAKREICRFQFPCPQETQEYLVTAVMISLKEACIHHYNACVFDHHLCQATDCPLLAISSQQLREEFSQDHDGNWSKLFDTRTIKERDVWFQNHKIAAQNITVSWLKYIQCAGTTPRHWKHHRSYCTFFCHKLKNHEAIASRGEVLERFKILSNKLMALWTCHHHVMVFFCFPDLLFVATRFISQSLL